MFLINKTTKNTENQPWRYENWLGEDWVEVPEELQRKALEHAPYCQLIFKNTEVPVLNPETGALQDIMIVEQLSDIIPIDMPIESLNQIKNDKQSINNTSLNDYLTNHPLTWSDGKQYGVTQEDQQEIALNLTQYQLSASLGMTAKLEWHAIHEECREFTQEELTGLAIAISEYVYPLVRRNQAIKTQIYSAKTIHDLEEIIIDYDT